MWSMQMPSHSMQGKTRDERRCQATACKEKHATNADAKPQHARVKMYDRCILPAVTLTAAIKDAV